MIRFLLTIMGGVIGVMMGWFGSAAIFDRVDQIDAADQVALAPRESILSARTRAVPPPFPSLSDLSTLEGIEAIMVKLNDASESEFKQWLRQLHADESALRSQWHVIELIAIRWASKDPEGAFAFARNESMTRLFGPILQQWARSDMVAAFEAATDADPRGFRTISLIERLDLDQMEDFYELLLDRGFHKQHPGTFGNIFSSLYQANPEIAATGALDLAMKDDRPFGWTLGLSNVIVRWVRDDPEAALQWAQGREDPKEREHALTVVAAKWIERRPVEGMSRFWDELNSEQRSHITNMLPNDLPEDVDGLLTWVDENVEALDWHGKILTKVIQGLRNSEQPEKLAEILPRLDPDFSGLDHAVGAAARKWAEKDAAGLKQWIDTLEDEKLRNAAFRGWLIQVAREDPLEAIAHLHSLEEDAVDADHHIRSLLGNALAKLGEQAKSDLTDVIEQLPESLRDPAMMSYAEKFARESPGETMALLLEQPDGTEQNRALQFTVGHWAAKDPRSAAEWVASLEESKHKEYAMRNLTNTWLRHDPEEAMAWIEEQPSAQSRDLAVNEVIRGALTNAPERALAMAQKVEDETQRHQLLQQSLINLAGRDPNKATQLLETTELPQDAVGKIELEISQTHALRRLED